MKKFHHQLRGNVHCRLLAGPCRLATRHGVELIFPAGTSFQYELRKKRGASVKMVVRDREKVGLYDPFSSKITLPGRGQQGSCYVKNVFSTASSLQYLTEIAWKTNDRDLVRWASLFGFFGAKNTGEIIGRDKKGRVNQIFVPGTDEYLGADKGLYYLEEPLEVMRQGLRAAMATCHLYGAIREKKWAPRKRTQALQTLLRQDGSLVGMFGIDDPVWYVGETMVGAHPVPKSLTADREWAVLGTRALSFLMQKAFTYHMKLGLEPRKVGRGTDFSYCWTVESWWGALALGMVRLWEKENNCMECGAPISRKAKFCSTRCRVRAHRAKKVATSGRKRTQKTTRVT